MTPKAYKGYKVLAVGQIMRASDLCNARLNPITKPNKGYKDGWMRVPYSYVGQKLTAPRKRVLWVVRKN